MKNETVTVCSACLTEACLAGNLMCEDARSAGTVRVPRPPERSTPVATATHTAFAHDHTGNPGPDPDTGDESWYFTPDGLIIENATGREIAHRNLDWPSGRFAADFADEALDRIGFRRTGPWEDLGGDWRAPLVATRRSAT